jgi:predicted nicotinamide N-methyase
LWWRPPPLYRKAGHLSRDHAAFIHANTRLLAVPFVPEIRLHLADEAMALWEMTEADLGRLNLPPPFWAFAWAGGQALARFILDAPEWVAGRHVLDFASGSGLCAIAAVQAGAARVQAVDIDPYATAAIDLNAAANTVQVEAIRDDLIGQTGPWTVILAGDISYQKDVADRVHAWLADEARRGVTVLIGDPDRAYLPRTTLKQLAAYVVPVLPSLEDTEMKRTFVLTLANGGT